MKNLNDISHEITKGKNLPQNLQKYMESMSSLYEGLAYIRLSMNDYTLYEIQREKQVHDERFSGLSVRFQELARVLADEGAVLPGDADALRNDVQKVMEVITAYVDRLNIYEYIINRVEYRFKDTSGMKYNDEELSEKIMSYIFSDRDNTAIISRILNVIGQLPMRLSRNKFYEYLRDAFTLYRGAQRGSIDDFAYMLRTLCMAVKPEGFETYFPEIYNDIEMLACADYANISEDEFNRLSEVLSDASEKVREYTDLFIMLAENINDLYTIVLAHGKTAEEKPECAYAREIIRAVQEGFESAEMPDLSGFVQERFESFEGRQERFLSILSQNDSLAEEAVQAHEDLLEEHGLRPAYEDLCMMVKLQSGSRFAPLNEDPERMKVTDESCADEACEALICELKPLFSQFSQPVRRAVMASILSHLPVFFKGIDELRQYINASLQQCADTAERCAVSEIMNLIMDDTV